MMAAWPLLLALAATGEAQAQGTAGERACADAVQGKVAWNRRGDRNWVPGNLARLCEGSTNPSATVSCFQAQIREHDDWNRGINACKGQAGAAAPAAVLTPGTNGRNASTVEFGGGGRTLGRFQQTGARLWVETNAAGQATFRFEETGRDDWSVYLVDRSRGVNLQLDLHTRKVMYSDASTPRRVQYEVLGASAAPVQAPPPVVQATAPPAYQPPPPAYTPPPVPAPAPVPQYTAPPPQYTPPPAAVAQAAGPSVSFGQGGQRLGAFRQVAPGRWVEADTAGNVRFQFEEAGRDDRSIYLFDRSRGVHIELGLHSRKVMYSDSQSARRPQYEVLDASF